MSSTTVMKAKAKLIKEETQEGANTAARVGGLFEDIVDYLDSADPTSSLKITPYITTGTRIAKFTVDGEETTIFAPSNGGSGGGGSAYDDTEIREIINELDKALDDTTALANSEKDRLASVIADIDENVKEKMQDAVEFAEWVQGNFPEGETGYQSGWNEKTKQFMQVVGMWDTSTDSPAVTTTKWSKLTQDVDDIYAEVTSISTGGEVTSEMVQSWIGTSVQNKIAELNLGTTYATQDDAGEILKWLYSALKGSTSEYETYNQFVSAARNGASTAISELRTYVEQLKDGSFIANANIVSKVDDAIAELYTSASSNNAKTYIFSTIDKNSQDIATIVSAATGDSVTVDIATRFATWKAGLATKSDLNSATAGLVAANDYNAAAIVAMIDNAESDVTISADHIEFTGKTIDATVSGGLNINNGKPGTQGNRNYVITANDTDGFSIESRGGSQDISIFNIDNEGNISHTYNGTETFAFDRDGAGHIANGNISWDANGAITLSSAEYEDEIGNTLRSFCSFDTYGVFKVHLDDVTNQQTKSEFSIAPSGILNYMVNGNDKLRINADGSGYFAGSNKITWSSAGGVNLAGGLSVGGDITADSGTVTTQTVTLSLGSGTTYKVGVIQNGNSYYLSLAPTDLYPNGGIMMNYSGRLGVWNNNSFKAAFDWSDIPSSETSITSIERFINSGSYQNGFTIKNGLIVSA